jgi:diguanylate cyclase (GGDEF)-like protein
VVQEARRTLGVLRQLTGFLSGGHPLEDRLQAITDAALSLLPCDHASIRLLDASRTSLLPGARSGKGVKMRTLALARAQGVAGWVVENGLPAHVRDTKSDPRFVVAVGQGFSVRSLLAEPLLAGGKPIGVLGASSPEANAFTDDDVLVARILASCTVPAIERARLERLSAMDDLTLAYTAQYLPQRLAEEMDRARHSGSALSVLTMDLDRLEHVSRSFGREVADSVLAIFSERVRVLTRRYDVLVRSGNGEFVLLLPGTSPLQAAASGEKLRMAIGDEPMEARPGGYISQRVSVGVATWDGRESTDSVMRRLGAALLASKARGGDTVSKAAPSSW